MPSSFVVSTPSAAVYTMRSGHMLGLNGDFLAAGLIACGEFCHVLPDYVTEARPLYAIYAHHAHMLVKLRVIIDYLVETPRHRPKA
ncbi:MAG: hypothetical protein WBV78_08685 [Roseobacter sp.]